ncbi:hypothetical protein D9619_011565 [Psilocybe cf. subviscida]|uniref:Uncharacterized protein n=1 Tax=Psilocybe cf. subviscida TaxID=2480587 RepID=A0A8H5BSH8_9AGAR|nr:hypothetical protein D9619_011565 [Psilocybe cf. subviscida]
MPIEALVADCVTTSVDVELDRHQMLQLNGEDAVTAVAIHRNTVLGSLLDTFEDGEKQSLYLNAVVVGSTMLSPDDVNNAADKEAIFSIEEEHATGAKIASLFTLDVNASVFPLTAASILSTGPHGDEVFVVNIQPPIFKTATTPKTPGKAPLTVPPVFTPYGLIGRKARAHKTMDDVMFDTAELIEDEEKKDTVATVKVMLLSEVLQFGDGQLEGASGASGDGDDKGQNSPFN